jgi:nanoRNase/pAp phosphatase (c-di-AMP/oligoRNAs hydrolase)
MDIQRAVELIEKGEHIALLLPEEPFLDVLAAAEVMGHILGTREKSVGIIIAGAKKETPHSHHFKILAASQPLTREFIITLDTTRFPISQLRYENKNDELEIILSPRSLPLKHEAVSFKDGKTLCDAVLAFGIDDIEALNTTEGLEPTFFTETPIINLDTSPDNKNYGEVNLVDIEKSSISEIVYELATALVGGPLSQEHATFILAGVIQKTRQFNYQQTTATTFLTVSELMRLGADLGEAQRIATTPQSLALLQLIGRSSVRTKTDDNGILWSFITAEDFEKTNRSPRDVTHILEHLQSTITPKKGTALLWQNPETQTIQATFTGDPSLLETLAARNTGHRENAHLLIPTSYSTFREAEEYISELLKGAL